MKIHELISRPIIRNDQSEEFLNKMSDNEIMQWEMEISQSLIADGVKQQFPEWNAAFLSKLIDWSIMYDIIKENEQTRNDIRTI